MDSGLERGGGGEVREFESSKVREFESSKVREWVGAGEVIGFSTGAGSVFCIGDCGCGVRGMDGAAEGVGTGFGSVFFSVARYETVASRTDVGFTEAGCSFRKGFFFSAGCEKD